MRAFRAVLSHPGATAMSGAAFVARWPMAMLGLALTLLVVAETGSYAWAGAVAGLNTVGGAIGGPVGSRLADRYGQHRVIPPLLGIHLVLVAALTASVMLDAPRPLWLVLALGSGLTAPGIGAMVRARWASLVANPQERSTAFALESTLDELIFVLGPPLATALAVGIAPWSAIACAMVLALAGGLTLAALRGTEPPPMPGQAEDEAGIWTSRAFRILVGLMLLMGVIFGALEVGTVAYAQEQGAVDATGWLLALFALGSGVVGLALGARPGTWRLVSQLATGVGALALTTAALPFVDGIAGYGFGMFAAGLGVSAVLIGSLQLIEGAVPRSRLTESLALAIAGIQVGFAAAAAISGALIDRSGSSAGLAVGSVAAVGAVLLLVLTGTSLRRAEATDRGAPGDDVRDEPAGLPAPSDGGTAPPG